MSELEAAIAEVSRTFNELQKARAKFNRCTKQASKDSARLVMVAAEKAYRRAADERDRLHEIDRAKRTQNGDPLGAHWSKSHDGPVIDPATLPKSCEHEFYFYPKGPNEDGWKCASCDHAPGEPPGFSPQLDRSEIESKVHGILLDLMESTKMIHVSNSDHGHGIVESVVARCRRGSAYDVYSILQYIMDILAPSHREYWKKVSKGVLSGNDPRERCRCGALANCWSSNGQGQSEHTCSKHRPTWESLTADIASR